MKARTFFCALVAATMIFAGCGKNNDNGDNNGDNNGNNNGGDTPQTITNYIIYDGVTYPMEAFDENHIDSSCSTESDEQICFWHSETYPKNHTIDLAHPAIDNQYWFHIDRNGGIIINAFGRGREDGTFDGFGVIDGETFNGESAFTSGTYCVSTTDPNGEGNISKIELDGVLRNGKRLQVYISMADNQ